MLEACCFQDADLQQLWDLLQQHATYEAEPSINYDAFMQVGRSKIAHEVHVKQHAEHRAQKMPCTWSSTSTASCSTRASRSARSSSKHQHLRLGPRSHALLAAPALLHTSTLPHVACPCTLPAYTTHIGLHAYGAQVGHRMEEVQPALARYFKPSVFMRFERDHRGMVPVQLLVNYLSARSYHLHLVGAALPRKSGLLALPCPAFTNVTGATP